ncbi:MAG: alginate lyase family protein [Tepidisphaeraceae bacterium]
MNRIVKSGMIAAAAALLAWGFDPSAWAADRAELPVDRPMVHPGGWHTADDIARVRREIASGEQPWAGAKAKLLATGPKPDYQPRPRATVSRAGGGRDQGGNSELQHDASNAYSLMIEWVATGDSRYGDAAIRVLDGWSAVLRTIQGSDARLAAGIYGNKFAQAAELAAYYKPDWPGKHRAQQMFLDVFLPVIRGGASANWGTSCMAGISSIGLFCDRPDLVNEAIHAYKFGWPIQGHDGAAAVGQYIDATGQCAESGRDQPHTQGGIGHLIETAVVAWNQGVNLFPYDDNRVVVGLEYTAKYNLGAEVPWHRFVDPAHLNDHWPAMSAKGRGRFSPIYEMADHYFTLAGIAHPYTHRVCQDPTYTPEITNNDHPGLGTLMFCATPAH